MLELTIATCSMDHGELCKKQDLSTEQRKLYSDRNYAIIPLPFSYFLVQYFHNVFHTTRSLAKTCDASM